MENFVYKALYYFHDGVRCVMILGTHVDDLLWANLPEAEWLVEEIRRLLKLGKEEEVEFTFCGKEFKQNLTDFSVKVTCMATTEKLGLVTIPGVNQITRKLLADPTPLGEEVVEQIDFSGGDHFLDRKFLSTRAMHS